ncbi:hypothetical protein [Nocardioides albidus]|nr:hypothetical protein [Nocardioides albidus]
MSPHLEAHLRRLDRAERRWLADARARLELIRTTRALPRKQER